MYRCWYRFYTYLPDLGRLDPQRALPALFALALGSDDLGAGFTQEGLFVDLGVREDPADGVRGSEGVHRPAVQGAALPLEQQPAAATVPVLRPSGPPRTAARYRLSAAHSGLVLGVRVRFGASGAVHFCTEDRFWELQLRGFGGL